jgi:hypothetical protein
MSRLSGPAALLHLEGLALSVAAILLYAHAHGNWLLFLVLILAPDLSMLGYLAGPRVGSIIYDLVHFESLPTALAVFALLAASQPALWVALIWLCHIGADRFFGFGLKYGTAFKATHLDRV